MSTEKEDTRDLYIRTPLEEFKAFSRHRIEILEKFKDVEKLKLYMDAFELGVRKLNDVMAPGLVKAGTTDLLAEEAPPFFEEETAAQETQTPEEEPTAIETPDKDSEEGSAGAKAREPDSLAREPEEEPPGEAGADGDEAQTLRILETEYFKSKEVPPVSEEAEIAPDSEDVRDTKDASEEDPSPSDSQVSDESYEEPMTEILQETVIAEFRGEDGKKSDAGESKGPEEGSEDAEEESEDPEEESEES